MTNILRSLSVFVLVAITFSCFVTTSPPRLTDSEMDALDPNGIVDLYWDASLKGDRETIERLVGSSSDILIWDCPPKPTAMSSEEFQLSKSRPRSVPGNTHDLRRGDKLDEILQRARALEIAHEPLQEYYEITERKISGSEARFIIRRKKKPTETSSLVIYMLQDSGRWRLIEVLSEGDLNLIGNKRFGEPRECPTGS